MVKRTKPEPEAQQGRGTQFAGMNEKNVKKTKGSSKDKGRSGREYRRGWDPNDPDQRVLGTQFWDAIPIMPVDIELRTKYSQHLFRRVRHQFAVNCYLAEMVPAVELWKHWQDITDAVGAVLDQAFDSVDQAFRESEDQSKHMIKVLGITQMPHYMNTQKHCCPINEA